MRRVSIDKFVYKWTYSTAILYAATLVTTIGYGNISPKTSLGKIITVICKYFFFCFFKYYCEFLFLLDALLGVLIVITWLKLVGESLALLVIKYYHYLEEYFQRYIKGKKIQLRNKVSNY